MCSVIVDRVGRAENGIFRSMRSDGLIDYNESFECEGTFRVKQVQ